MAFECVLSGTTSVTQHARKLSSGRRSPQSLSVSQAEKLSRQPLTTTEELLGVPALISELACTSAGGPCYGENGEPGYAVRDSCSKKKRYWSNPNSTNLASFATQCSSAGEPVYERAKVGLRSFSPINEQNCSALDDAFMSTLHEQPCAENGSTIPATEDFQFPNFDQLPLEFQNPTSSADFCSSIPISAAGMNMTAMDSTATETYPWDNEEMNFAMDMDLDLDMDLNMLGKC